MARLFDNNIANYMRRQAVTLGVGGLTEASFAFWINITGTTGVYQPCIVKHIGAGSDWGTIYAGFPAGTTDMTLSVQNRTAVIWPQWTITSGLPLTTWVRCMLAWKRTAAAVAGDGIFYANGIVQPTTFTANGYVNTFTPGEDSNNYYFGQNDLLGQAINASLEWVTVWNRQLTGQEAIADYLNPLAVTAGRLSSVQICPDFDRTLGGGMTVIGSLACMAGPPILIEQLSAQAVY